MGVLCFVYMICALRTNIVFVGIFATLVPAFGCLAGAYIHLAKGNAALAVHLQVVAGACTFVTCMLGWWIFFAILLASLDFPFQLPGEVGSHVLCASVRLLIVIQLAISLTLSRVLARRPRRRMSTRHKDVRGYSKAFYVSRNTCRSYHWRTLINRESTHAMIYMMFALDNDTASGHGQRVSILAHNAGPLTTSARGCSSQVIVTKMQ